MCGESWPQVRRQREASSPAASGRRCVNSHSSVLVRHARLAAIHPNKESVRQTMNLIAHVTAQEFPLSIAILIAGVGIGIAISLAVVGYFSRKS